MNRVKSDPLPLPDGRTLLFVHISAQAEGYFICSACKKKFMTTDPAEGHFLFQQHTCVAPNKKRSK